LELPIALVLGAKDKLVDLKEVDNFAKHSSCKIHSMDEVGHFPFFENPHELSKLVTSIA
jgi:pimeloyl-ACP methyl ester carboxylesterase